MPENRDNRGNSEKGAFEKELERQIQGRIDDFWKHVDEEFEKDLEALRTKEFKGFGPLLDGPEPYKEVEADGN